MVRSYLPENIRIYMLFIIFQNQWLLLINGIRVEFSMILPLETFLVLDD